MNEPTRILIIDDEASQRKILQVCFEKRGYAVQSAATGEDGVQRCVTFHPHVVVTDYSLGGMNGLDVLEHIKRDAPATEVIIITAFGEMELVIKALRSGAADFILKPVELESLLQAVHNAAARARLLAAPLAPGPAGVAPLADLITADPVVEHILLLAVRAAQSDATILIRGESGTGKELLARAIHHASLRADKPLVVVNCAALNENLLESELFGHCKGSFTGAVNDRVGRFAEADHGTIFLDEVGDLPLGTQVKLLRVLQNGELQRVGENRTTTVDVRVIAATNQDLEHMLGARTFRQDLYYRLNVVSFRLPPLRERPDDILPLAQHFLQRYARRLQRPVPALTARAHAMLARHPYPGNVRELENIIQRTLVLMVGDEIDTVTISADAHHPSSAAPPADSESEGNLDTMIDTLERATIERALQAANFNQSQAARTLGVTLRALRYRMQRLGLK
ncbi:MAG: sigma-54 dependent transcriptional regulator [bacterium]|nr:sigma-54 dependent transcriptional regulator [bacterium]